MEDISNEIKKEIIEAKLADVKKIVFSLEIDAKVAQITGDADMKTAVQKQLKIMLARQEAYLQLLKEDS